MVNRNSETGRIPPMIYEIKIRGTLDESWSEWFDGMEIQPQAGGATLTRLRGPVEDQAALHGVLQKLRDLHLPLISLNLIETGLEMNS